MTKITITKTIALDEIYHYIDYLHLDAMNYGPRFRNKLYLTTTGEIKDTGWSENDEVAENEWKKIVPYDFSIVTMKGSANDWDEVLCGTGWSYADATDCWVHEGDDEYYKFGDEKTMNNSEAMTLANSMFEPEDELSNNEVCWTEIKQWCEDHSFDFIN